MTDENFARSTGPDPEDLDVEVPDADVVERAAFGDSADPADSAGRDAEVHRGLEVSEWDAVEQAHVVDLSDEY